MRWRIPPWSDGPAEGAAVAQDDSSDVLEIIPVEIKGEVELGDCIAELIDRSGVGIRDGDVVVVSQKIVSKQEGRILSLSEVIPTMLAYGIASEYGKDPRLVQAVLSESRSIVRMSDGIIITETHSGIVCANAGVDESNVKNGMITLLPVAPDTSARLLRGEIGKTLGKDVAVLISDTFGRPLRMGQTDCAIGVSGLQAIRDYRGIKDKFGRELRVTAIAVADELCAAAELVMGKTRGCPAAIIRNYPFPRGEGQTPLSRPRSEDLFR